ncbi:hypothetical protein KAU45_00580 [bacterium]|nr:hypothetical protein [bacterium]
MREAGKISFGVIIVLVILAGCTPEHGPGGPLASGRYALQAPHDAWSVQGNGYESSALFVRSYQAGSEDELAYLECLYYDRYLDPEEWIRSAGAEEQVLADLAAMLRLEITRLSPELEWIGTEPITAAEPALSAAWRFHDFKEQLHADSPAKTFNEVSLALIGDDLHLVAFYCYSDEAEELVPEYEALKGSLTVDGRRIFAEGGDTEDAP